jgi:hypothetical protein
MAVSREARAWRNELSRRASAGVQLLRRDGRADPLLILSYVVWPGQRERERHRRRARPGARLSREPLGGD